MSKKILSLLLAVMLVGVLAVGCSSTEEPVAEAPATEEAPAEEAPAEEAPAEEAPAEEATLAGEGMIIGMITDTGGLGDQSFNDSAWLGIQNAETELGIDPKVLQSSSADDYLPNLTSFAEEEVALTIGVGFLFEESMKQAAETFPNQNFAVVDTVIDMPNIASLTFAEHEGSFLVGVIAGMATETDTVGFIGGMEFPSIQKFEFGFKAGVKSVNPDATVLVNYADSFDDAAKGKEIAIVQNQSGADVIFHAAGGVGIGLIQAAGENDFWAIGVDQDQSAIDPEHVLASMIKRVDTATYAATKSVVDGTFAGGVQLFNVANDGVGYSDNAGNLSAEQIATADAYKALIADGAFEVPSILEELEAFVAPEM